MGIRRLVIAFLAIGAWAPHAASAAEPRILVPSGTVVDGAGLTRFQRPAWAGGSDVVFRGVTERITLPDDMGTPRTVVSSGTPVPGVADGTLNSFEQVAATADGFVAFAAEINAPDVDEGIFVVDGGTIVPVVARATGLGAASLSGIDLNPRGDLAYATDAGVFRRLRASGQSTMVAALGPMKVFRSPAIDASGAVAWIEGKPKVSVAMRHWSEALGVQTIAVTGGPVPGSTATFTDFVRLDVHETAGVAFIAGTSSAAGAFVWNPATGDTQAIARVGDVVDGMPITRLLTQIGFRRDGTLVVRARVGNRTRWVVASGGLLTVSRSSGLTAGAVGVATRDGLYLSHGGTVGTLAQIGDPNPELGVIAGIGTVAVRGHAVAFIATNEDGTSALLRRSAAGVTTVLLDGAPLPGGGTVGFDGTLDVSGKVLAFGNGSAVVVLRDGRPARVIQPPNPVAAEATFFVDSVRIGTNAVFVGGGFSEGRQGIFVAKGNRLRPFVVTGDAAPGPAGSTFSSVSGIVDGSQVYFVGRVGEGDYGLYLARGDGIRKLRSDLSMDGGPSYAASLRWLGIGGRVTLFATDDAIYRASGKKPVLLVQDGQVNALGTIGFEVLDDLEAPFAVDGKRLVFRARLLGGRAREAILERAVSR